jgi:microcystin-dependent protein
MGELRIMGFNFPPKGWAQCNGQFLPINQNQALFSLLGTTYGGNGQTTFALPDLRGRTPIHTGSSFSQGTAMGQEAHTITMSEMPAHVHFFGANTGDATKDNATLAPKGTFGAFNNGYRAASNLIAIAPTTISNVGGSQAHENRQPYAVLNICICLQGIFPSRN